MISNDSNTSQGCSGWLKWLIGTGLALIAAGGSFVAMLQYFNPRSDTPSSNTILVLPATNVPSPEPQVVSPELWQAVEGFLNIAVVSEIAAYQYGDSAYGATMFHGDAMQSLQDQIADLNSRGVMRAARFDSDNSYIYDIRFTQNDRIEVDSCEYWANDYYDRQTGTLLSSDSWTLVPQTILIEYLDAEFYITSVAFYTGQAFCY